MIFDRQQETKRFLKFALVGTIGAIVDFGIFNFLAFVLDVSGMVAQAVSFTCAVCSNFIWNRYWTYPDSRSKKLYQQIIQFFIVNLIGLAIRTPLFVFMEGELTQLFELMNLLSDTATILGHNFALAFAVLVVMMWNFFINRVWTYSDVNKVRAA